MWFPPLDEAQYQGKIVFGDNSMELDSWRVDSSVGLTGTYSITVDKDCIPNGESIVGKLSGLWGANRKYINALVMHTTRCVYDLLIS